MNEATRKTTLQGEHARLMGELDTLRPKLETLEPKVSELHNERADMAKRLALGTATEKDFNRAATALSDAIARHDGVAAAIRDVERELDGVQYELDGITRQEAQEAHERAVAAARREAEGHAGRVTVLYDKLALALGDALLSLHALAELSDVDARAVASVLRNERQVAALVAAGYLRIGLTPDGEGEAAVVPAMIARPVGLAADTDRDWVPLAFVLRAQAAPEAEPAAV